MGDMVSIVVPCYNEESVIHDYYTETTEILSKEGGIEDYEIIFVDDGSTDRTREIIKDLSKADSHVEYLSFSRNFGKESAMYAGLTYAEGVYTVIMDADLQHPPKYIPNMLEEMKSGDCDMVATRRKKRGKESVARSLMSQAFYKVMNRISGIDMGDNAMDYRMLNRKAKNAIINMAEYNRFSKGIFEWIGFRTKWMEIEINERQAGESKWSFRKLFAYSLEGIIAFSTMPLHISSVLGLLFFLAAFVMIAIMVVESLLYGVPGTGYVTIICLILLTGGLQFFCIGILGQYLAKDYLENKNRPIYLVQESSKDIV